VCVCVCGVCVVWCVFGVVCVFVCVSLVWCGVCGMYVCLCAVFGLVW